MKVQSAFVVLALEFCLLATPASVCSAQNPLAALANAAKEKAAEEGLETLLNNQLPLALDANNVYPTVNQLPGGPFNPTPLKLTADELDQPLPPGDYTINTLDFCSEYSVHEPGAGVAYILGPYKGKAADAIGALIWRGTVKYHINPGSLQAVSWTIQSGLTYAQMPKSYQAIVDQVIPDYKSEIASDFFVNLQASYNSYAKTAQLPPFDAILAKLGKPGELALSAERQRTILTRQNTSDQIRDQTLFQGQQSGLYTPVKEENGPWTERVKGQVYMKLQIAGGNMATNNVMMIRVMPPPMTNSRNDGNGAHLVLASFGEPQAAAGGADSATSVTGLMEGMIGYSQGRGAQALGQVPVIAPGAPPPAKLLLAGKVEEVLGSANVIRAGTTTAVPLKPGDSINVGDTLVTGANSGTDVLLADKTQLVLGANSKVLVDNYVYDPNASSGNSAVYRFFEGTFQYLGGLIDKKDPGDVKIDTPVDGVGIRGTEFIGKYDAATKTMEIDLISGAVALTPKGGAAGPTMAAPAVIKDGPSGMQVLPLTQQQYNTMKSQLAASAVPTT